VPLFDRQGRRIRLNPFGVAFLRRMERVFAELEDGRREVADLAGLEHGRVSLAATTLRLPQLFNGFLAAHPHVSFRLMQSSSLEMQRQLESGEVDLCIASPPLTRPRIRSVPMLTEELLLVVPVGHRLAGKDHIALREVAEEPFIAMKAGYGLRDIADECCRQAGFAPALACECDELAAIRGLVSAGLGVAFFPPSGGEPRRTPVWSGCTSRSQSVGAPSRSPGARTAICRWPRDDSASSCSTTLPSWPKPHRIRVYCKMLTTGSIEMCDKECASDLTGVGRADMLSAAPSPRTCYCHLVSTAWCGRSTRYASARPSA
jgi:DNA-binding transcriptional LysR family regulator